jgi:hypothetical protein
MDCRLTVTSELLRDSSNLTGCDGGNCLQDDRHEGSQIVEPTAFGTQDYDSERSVRQLLLEWQIAIEGYDRAKTVGHLVEQTAVREVAPSQIQNMHSLDAVQE